MDPTTRNTTRHSGRSSVRALVLAALCAVLAVGLPGCSDGPTAPVGDDPDDDLPELEVFDVSASPGRTTSDLWVHGSHAYTGTWANAGPASSRGNALFVWDLADPRAPALVDSVIVDAGVVNDVKVSPDGSLAVLTREHASDGTNGIVLLDLSGDPAHPTVRASYTTNLEVGVHNVWLENDHVYVVTDGSAGLRIVNVSEPATPVEVGDYPADAGTMHDVYVRDDLAFLAHWDQGLVILDVGNGIEGGSPANPRVVSTVSDLGGETHNAWYWPEAGYVFVGEEDHSSPGIMRVLDVTDLTAPEVVATFGVPGDTPHNFWLDESNEILYMAWYTRGVRVLDVSGDLSGDLSTQERELAVGTYGPGDGYCPGRSGPTCTWAPQVHDGHLYVSDIRHGLVTLGLAP